VDGNVLQMLVNQHAAVVGADVVAALVEVHTNWFLQKSGSKLYG
jgi:hypothetical protein